MYGCWISVSVGLLTVRMKAISDTFAYAWDPFLPTGCLTQP